MKSLTVIALVIGCLGLSFSIVIGYLHIYNINKINELRKEHNKLSKEFLDLQQELAKSWGKDKSVHGYGSHNKEDKEQWPKFHDTTAVIKFQTDNRIVVDQDEVPGFMKAMLMSYRVENLEQLKDLDEGDKVKLKLKETEADLTVIDIKRIEK